MAVKSVRFSRYCENMNRFFAKRGCDGMVRSDSQKVADKEKKWRKRQRFMTSATYQRV